MPDFYVSPKDIGPQEVVLTGDEFHHAVHVCRVVKGQTITLTDGAGNRYEAIVQSLTEDCLQGKIQRNLGNTGELPIRVVLLIAVIRPSRWEIAVEKTTELGVYRLIPLVSEHSVRKPYSSARLERFRKVALSAGKQSERAVIPQLGNPILFDEAVTIDPERTFIASPESGINLRELLGDRFPVNKNDTPEEIRLLIGPEGGFSKKELSLAHAHHIPTFHLGPRKLRAETAAILTMGIMGEWMLESTRRLQET